MDATLEPGLHTPRWHLAAAALGLAGLCYAGARIGLVLSVPGSPFAVIWPPGALLMAALLLAPRRWWWGLVAAALAAHLLAHAEAGSAGARVFAGFAGDVAEAALGALLVARVAGPAPWFQGARSVIAFLAVSCAAAFVSTVIDVTFVRDVGMGDPRYGALWGGGFLSHLLAALLLVPALVTWAQAPRGQFPRLGRTRHAEAAVLGAGLLACMLFAIPAATGPAAAWLLFVTLPFLAWAALRFGPSLCSLASAVVAVAVLMRLYPAKGPGADTALGAGALATQLLLVSVATALLLLAAVVAERRTIERRLRNSRELFSALFGASPDAVAICRRSDGQTIAGNAEWTRLMGEEASSRRAVQHSELDTPSRLRVLELARQGSALRKAELSLRDRDGHARVVQLSGATVELAGESCDLSIVRDITALRQAESDAREQRKQLTHLTRVASLTDFSGTLAHELTQPLAAILSNAQAALRMLSNPSPNVPEVRVILRDIAEADKRAGDLIRRLRLLMKNSDEEFLLVDCNHLVREVLDLVQGEFLLRKIELRASFAADLPQVRGDHVQLQQLVLNLVLNACEAMQGHPGTERVLSIDTHHGADGSVQILVTDTGPGIPQESLDRVFEAFYTTKANGLGLGLSICRKIAAAHGGTLSARSSPGRGAAFRCTLPAAHGIESFAAASAPASLSGR